VRFLEPLTAAILAGRRNAAPHGMNGGFEGEAGRTWVERSGGHVRELAYADEVQMQPGDVFVISTPSGGGFGAPE
jgi:5-oxoprolinase (ATP-hydrolysing)